jgi:hypothetical protein
MPAVQTISNVFLGLSAITILSGIVFAVTRNNLNVKRNKKFGVENLDQKSLQKTNPSEKNLGFSVKRSSHIALFVVGLIFTILGVMLKINQ